MHNIGEDDEANPPENIKHTGMEMWKHICSLSGALGSAYIKNSSWKIEVLKVPRMLTQLYISSRKDMTMGFQGTKLLICKTTN